jgi:hypothetical protein
MSWEEEKKIDDIDFQNEEPEGMDQTVDNPEMPCDGNNPNHGSPDVIRQRETSPLKVFGEKKLLEDFLSQERFLSPVVNVYAFVFKQRYQALLYFVGFTRRLPGK